MKCWVDECPNFGLIPEKDGSISVYYCIYCYRKQFNPTDSNLLDLLISIESYHSHFLNRLKTIQKDGRGIKNEISMGE